MNFRCEFMCFEKFKNICQKNGLLKNRDLKIPKFYSIEYENFSKFYQTQINENICQKNGLSKNRDLKIPKFYSIEYENFSKFYQTQINENICQKMDYQKIEI